MLSTREHFVKCQRSPAAENVALAAAGALCTAARLLDFVNSFGIDAERFLPLAQQCGTFAELQDAVLAHVKENQKG